VSSEVKLTGVTFVTRDCSIARALDLIGEKWSLLAIREVFLGSFKFNEIQDNTGAPRDVLSDRLRKLVESGVMQRTPYQEHPQRFDYRLTPMGADLFGAITVLREWGDRHCGEPPRTFQHKCGAVVATKLVCRACDEEVTERNVRPIDSVTLGA
jgi:DNA-binding HxlR family transcriptional regulator